MMYRIMHAKMHTHCMKKQDRERRGKIKREEVRQMARECERHRESLEDRRRALGH